MRRRHHAGIEEKLQELRRQNPKRHIERHLSALENHTEKEIEFINNCQDLIARQRFQHTAQKRPSLRAKIVSEPEKVVDNFLLKVEHGARRNGSLMDQKHMWRKMWKAKRVPSEIENPERFSKVEGLTFAKQQSLFENMLSSFIHRITIDQQQVLDISAFVDNHKKFQRIEKNRLEEFFPPPADTQWFWIYPCLAIFHQGNNDDAPALEKIPQITVQLLDRLRYELEQEDRDISICLAHLWRAITLRSTPSILRDQLCASADAAIVGANEVMGGHRKLSKKFFSFSQRWRSHERNKS